jgi:2'-5' RNA ligase
MRDAHATVFLDGAALARVEPLRKRWDPLMAAQIRAHVTVTYPAEILSASLLAARLEAAAQRVGPFRLWLGEVRCFGESRGGLFVEVTDLDGGWLALREAVGFTAERREVTPHVTLVHPRTSDRGLDAWADLHGTDVDIGVEVRHAVITAFDGRVWRTDATYDLAGPAKPSPAA